MGVSAVPGSGKTHVLSKLAARIISSGVLLEDQEVLIVTLVNSAVDNFELRIRENFDNPLLALYKYRVRTLHGLAHDILREKPAQAGLEERFTILDEREADSIRRETVTAWLSSHPDGLEDYLDPSLEPKKRDWVRRQHLPEMLASLAVAFIRSCKDRRITPEILRDRLDQIPSPLPLAELGWQLYADYQRGLVYRSAVDFDDLIRLAVDVLEDKDYLERLRYRFPFILEDEAQDSSKLQETILGSITGPEGNWVRVGDPNQAIFETFTTASPQFLRDFIRDHFHVDMAESGRSQPAIIELANHLIEWVMAAHPENRARDALQPPLILPTPAGDPQPNPPADRSAIQLISGKLTAEQELIWIVDSLLNWLPDHPDSTVAVLAPRNQRGSDLIKILKERKVEFVEMLNSTMETRAAAGALGNLLNYLSEPGSSTKLAKAYQVWRRDVFGSNASDAAVGSAVTRVKRSEAEHLNELIRKVKETEAYLKPTPDQDWLASLSPEIDETLLEELLEFRSHAQRWLNAVRLPIDQLILTLAQDIFTDAADLALAHKLALVLRKAAVDHPEWRLPELSTELSVIARNERKFIGFGNDDSGFDPLRHKGKVVVTTMHKSKGLEWDRVYLMSVNNYDFPSNQANDRYISEKWFVRNNLNLEAEVLEQLKALLSSSRIEWYSEGSGTLVARLDYAKERLRLLYVGITRAKKDLIITWNTGRQGNLTQSLALAELAGWWQA
jgi:DNA helicase-2/ATP-dependent DNA helicase PcrA